MRTATNTFTTDERAEHATLPFAIAGPAVKKLETEQVQAVSFPSHRRSKEASFQSERSALPQGAISRNAWLYLS